MDNIKSVVQKVIGDLSSHRQSREEDVFLVWQGLFSKKALQHQKLIGIKENNLFVHVDSSVWLYEMKLRQNEYLKAIQKKVPDIQKIIFKIGSVK